MLPNADKDRIAAFLTLAVVKLMLSVVKAYKNACKNQQVFTEFSIEWQLYDR